MAVKDISFDETFNVINFTFVDTNPSLINSLRRYLLSNMSAYSLHVTGVTKNQSEKPDEEIIKNIKMIRLNQKFNMIHAQKFSINITNNDSDIMIVTSDDIRFSSEGKMPCYPGIYIATLEKGKSLQLSGIVRLSDEYPCCSSVGFKVVQNSNPKDPKSKIIYNVTIHNMECYSPKDLMMNVCNELAKKFQQYDSLLMKIRKDMGNDTYSYETGYYSETILNPIVKDIYHNDPQIPFVAFRRPHMLIDYYVLSINTKSSPDTIIKDAISRIVNKLKNMAKQFETALPSETVFITVPEIGYPRSLKLK